LPIDPAATQSASSRTLSLANVGSVLLGAFTFIGLAFAWDSYVGALAAALIAAAVTGAAWWLWIRATRPPDTEPGLDVPEMGVIPAYAPVPAPTLSDPDSAASSAYNQVSSSLARSNTATVLLVTGPSPGSGASSVAMNLAISSTRAGRKVVLVDGDRVTQGLTRFVRTKDGPGLSELASGTADLNQASRMWVLDDANRLPFIPAGGALPTDGDGLRSASIAEAIDRMSETADLILIDTSPATDNEAIDLAAHADGSLLVIPSQAEAETAQAASRRLEEAGAAVVGFVINGAPPYRPPTPARVLKRSLAAFAVAVIGFLLWNGVQIWDSWRTAERESLDVVAAAGLLPLPADSVISAEIETLTDDLDGEIDEDIASLVAPPAVDEEKFQSFLLVGSDEGGTRADVIILLLQPPNGAAPAMVSLPRDLWVPNRCSQNLTRINVNLRGCGETVNGPTLLALAVEDFTGITVDHFALFSFDGFELVIDELGGVEICLENAVRDSKSELRLPAGCTNATGAQALSWVRSRSTQEKVNGTWQRMANASDLTRNTHQQDVILAMISKAKTFESVSELASKFRSLTDFFTFDDQLGFTEAVALAWSLRDIEIDTVLRIEIPVSYHTTSGGAEVLLPKVSFDVLLLEIYPNVLDPS
jgi:LCP family protein required for cell wall assembly